MRCTSCWREARKIAHRQNRRASTVYRHMHEHVECTHGAKPNRKAPREIALSFTANLTPLHDLFPSLRS
jgi:hypothetical protein